MHLLFTLMGKYAQSEVASSHGRADMIVLAAQSVYCFEFKLDGKGTAEDALAQIDERGYLEPWKSSGKRLVKIGVVFDPATRTVAQWKAAE